MRLLSVLLVLSSTAAVGFAQDNLRKLIVKHGESSLVSLSSHVTRITVDNAKVIDVVAISQTTLSVEGKAPGKAVVKLYEASGEGKGYTVTVE
jgi:Flp pilus assembly secretin CpaC